MDRSANMRAIRSKGMLPELAVRQLVHKFGYRFRLHRKDLPGKPDLVFAPRRKVIFVHGCFWHRHDCKTAHVPKSNPGYWLPKLRRNQARDREHLEALTGDGWDVLVIWECEVKDIATISARVRRFLSAASAKAASGPPGHTRLRPSAHRAAKPTAKETPEFTHRLRTIRRVPVTIRPVA